MTKATSLTPRVVLGSILFFIACVVYTPFHAIYMIVAAPCLTLRQRYLAACTWNRIIVQLLSFFCGVNYQVQGKENLPTTRAIILAKHQSAWETFAIPVELLPNQLCFVFKKELLRIPFFGWAMATMKMIAIDRSKGRDAFTQILEASQDRMKAGAWMMFFPEGTRVPVGQKKRYKTGGARLAIATNTPVVPVALNAGEFWAKRQFFKKPGTITLRFGPPISPTGHTAESLTKAVENWIEQQMADISPQHYPATNTAAPVQTCCPHLAAQKSVNS